LSAIISAEDYSLMVENETAADNHKSNEASDKFGHEDV